MQQWEYVHVQYISTEMPGMVRVLNDAGARGWELIAITDNDPTLGVNSLVAVLKRPIEPLDRPDDAEPGWHADPSGRFEHRYWDGEAWTFRVASGGTEDRDPPTARTPAQVPQ